MRTFGTETDNLIDVELAYGTNNYEVAWFQNGLQREIEVTKVVIHFVGSKAPLGNVTIDYLELDTKYLDFLEEDAIRIDITEDNSTLTVGTYYVAPGFTKTKYDASYTAYSSLIDLGLKLDAWSGAPESATIGSIVHHFIDTLDIVFDVEPSSTVTFNAAITDFSSVTLAELLGYCACIERCNYVLRGNVLYRVVPAVEITKEYNIDDIVYSENLSQITSDAALDYIKVNYKTISQETDEDGQVSYEFNDASYICKDGTETCGFEANIGLVPTSESALQALFSNYFLSVKGMDCNGYDISFLGDARIEIGDKLKFSNNEDSAVLNVAELTWEWDGGLKCTVSSGTESSSSSGSGFSIQQVVSQIQAMTNAVKNVQYNAVYANELYAKNAELGFASIKELSAEVVSMGLMTADQADIAYAKIDMSNIEKATIGTVLADIGLISDATIVNGHVTGYLSSVEVDADYITAGTLAVDRLIIRGSTESLVYELNNITGALQAASVDTLNGEIITPRTINADKIVANSITASELAANSVTAEKILSYSITADKLAVGSVTADKIVANSITADKMAVDAIKSLNYVENSSGSFLNLEDGSFDSAYTKIDSDGKLTCSYLNLIGGRIDIQSDSADFPVIETYYGDSVRMQISPEEIYSYSNGEYISIKSELLESWVQATSGGTKTYRYSLDEWDCVCYSNGYSFSDLYSRFDVSKGGTATPIYLNSGFPTACSATIGGTAKPIYMNAGTLTACSATVGSADTPVYINAGTITSTGKKFSSYLPLTGGTISGTIAVTRSATLKGGVELYGTTPYIDFHYGNSTADYTSRLYASSATALRVTNNFAVNGDLYCIGTYGTTVTSAANVHINSSHLFRRYSSSSKRYKFDINTIGNNANLDPHKLYDLPVVQFKYNEGYLDGNDARYMSDIPGFIAEDVESIYPIAVDRDVESGLAEDWNPRYIIPGLLKLIQEQNERIKILEMKG